jgi:hypothetical protein
MTAQVNTGSTFVPLALPFGTVSVGNADGTLYANLSSLTSYRMPQRGSVIGCSSNMTGTLLTGTLQFTPTKNGTPMTGTFSNGTINIGTLGNDQRVAAQQGIFSFDKGDNIGLMFNKTGSITPTTRDLNALLLVLLDNYDF